MDLSERCLHAGLVGDVEAEGAAKEGRPARGREEEDEAVARSYHDTVLSGKLRQEVRWATDRHRCELPGNYPVFIMVMVIYTSVWKIMHYYLTPNFF